MKIEINNRYYIVLGFTICAVATMVAWFRLSKLEAIVTLSQFSFASGSLIFANTFIASFLAARNNRRLIYKIMFGVTMAFSLTWFMLTLMLPIFIVKDVDINAKIATGLMILFFFYKSAETAKRAVLTAWDKNIAENVYKYLDKNDCSINWEKIKLELGVSLELYWPNFLVPFKSILEALLIIIMILGLSVRNVYPHISLFMIGLPAGIAAACCFQMIIMALTQAHLIRQIETSEQIKIFAKE